jgi:DNA polymerase-3 subunit delta
MKIAAKAIDSFISSPQREHNAVLIYGVDSGLVRERAGKITKSILGEAASDNFAKIEISGAELAADPPRLADELSAISMMCPKRVIIIRDVGDKLSKIIEEASSCFHKDNYLIITADDLSGKSSLRSFFEKKPDCAVIACYKDEMRDVQNVIRQKLDAAGVAYNREVLEYLTGQLGNDRYVTYQELEKLIIYAGDEKELTLHDAQLLVDNNQDMQMDDIVNAVADRNLIALEKTLTQHLREGTQPIMYLRSLQRYFNRLYAIHSQIQESIKQGGGQNVEAIISGLRPPVFWKQQPILVKHAKNWNLENIIKALRLIISAELVCKTSDLPIIPASSRKLLQVTQVR